MTDALWPFNRESFTPHGYRQNLLRAQALLLAEMERIKRLADTVQYFRVPGSQGALLYYAADRDTLITLLATTGQSIVLRTSPNCPARPSIRSTRRTRAPNRCANSSWTAPARWTCSPPRPCCQTIPESERCGAMT